VSNIFIPDEARRAAFRKEIDRSGYSQLNTLGLTACKAAYEGGAEWLDACKVYLRANLDFMRDYLARELPQIRLVEPDGTYFAWLDCSGLSLTREELDDLIVNRAGLWLDAGHVFGGGADQFQRVVLACPRATLEQALAKLKAACESLN
jgi:cystathionine beta-lyase